MFREDFLPFSQTFVFEEIRLLPRHRVDVFAWRRLNETLFPYDPVYVGGVPFLLTGYQPAFHSKFRSQPYELIHAHFGTSGMYALPYAVAIPPAAGRDVSRRRCDGPEQLGTISPASLAVCLACAPAAPAHDARACVSQTKSATGCARWVRRPIDW